MELNTLNNLTLALSLKGEGDRMSGEVIGEVKREGDLSPSTPNKNN